MLGLCRFAEFADPMISDIRFWKRVEKSVLVSEKVGIQDSIDLRDSRVSRFKDSNYLSSKTKHMVYNELQ